MKKFKKIVAVLLAVATVAVIGSGMIAQAQEREKDYFDGFKVTYSSLGTERYTKSLTKLVTNRNAVVNLEKDNTSNWIMATVRNSDNASRGSVYIKEGTRKTFACSGTRNYKYKLGLKKTNSSGGTTAYLYGSWSPDAY